MTHWVVPVCDSGIFRLLVWENSRQIASRRKGIRIYFCFFEKLSVRVGLSTPYSFMCPPINEYDLECSRMRWCRWLNQHCPYHIVHIWNYIQRIAHLDHIRSSVSAPLSLRMFPNFILVKTGCRGIAIFEPRLRSCFLSTSLKLIISRHSW